MTRSSYEHTVDDPAIFHTAFTVAVPMRRNDEPAFIVKPERPSAPR